MMSKGQFILFSAEQSQRIEQAVRASGERHLVPVDSRLCVLGSRSSRKDHKNETADIILSK